MRAFGYMEIIPTWKGNLRNSRGLYEVAIYGPSGDTHRMMTEQELIDAWREAGQGYPPIKREHREVRG